ncbi:Na-translocating system protein MpsC family protein [uncultured Clostridium sp.]|uniref:Na-translocating system protein MpsC family protein n=1 Tax=uncultured Clostridium sp. TaxID=59620 RepID=UPI0028E66A7D|nr:Na-translocating system protein MpsC family protein [uncultured Clostridium sp.]
MSAIDLELQERIKKVTVKIVKHYRGRGPEYVKVKIDSPDTITVEIKGILSNLSEILVNESAVDIVADYWKIMKPHLEKSFLQEVKDILKKDFTYSWKICNIENDNRTVVITIKLID